MEHIYATRNWTKQYKKQNTEYKFTVTAEMHSLGGQDPYFSLTGYGKAGRDDEFGGCCHEDIVAAFPFLEKYIKWHMFAWPSGPMHYVANTIWHAGNKDCWGRTAGEPSRYEYEVMFGDSPVGVRVSKKFWEWLKEPRDNCDDYRDRTLVAVEHGNPSEYKFGPHYTVSGYYVEWHKCPFRDAYQAEQFIAAVNSCDMLFNKVPVDFSEGKERNLGAARHCAIWPEATDEQLCLPRDELKQLLIGRLPALKAEFKADMTELFGDQLTWIDTAKETYND